MENKNSFYSSLFNLVKMPLLFLITGCALLYVPMLHFFKAYHFHYNILLMVDNFGLSLIILSFLTFFYLIISNLVNYYKHYFFKKKNTILGHILGLTQNGLNIIFALISINCVVNVFNFNSHYRAILNNVTFVLITVSICWILLRIFSAIEDVVHQKRDNSLDLNQRKQNITLYTRIHILRNVASTLVIIIGMAACLMIFEKIRSVGISLLASAGVLTAIVALASQKTLTSIFSGIQLAFSQPVEIGDLITIENETGVIEEITLSYILVKIDVKRLVIPIQYFIDKSFVNWSIANNLHGIIHLYIKPTMSVDALRQEMFCVLKEADELWDQYAAELSVSDIKQDIVEIKILLSASSPVNLDKLKNLMREKLLKFLNAEKTLEKEI